MTAVSDAINERERERAMGGGKRVGDHLGSDVAEITEDSFSTSSSDFSSSACSRGCHYGSCVDDMLGESPVAPVLQKTEDHEIVQRRRCRTYLELLRTYESSGAEARDIQHAKNAIRRYKPGDWIEEVGGTNAADHEVPEITTLLLVGPRGAGKSTLVNRISRVFEDEGHLPDRAQVSYNVWATEGTCFLQEYMFPRNSKSFCIYDTRSLSLVPSDNFNLLKHWMTQGVNHGEMVIRDSDDVITRKNIKAMARQGHFCTYQRRRVNFVIFVVDGVSVLKSMEGKDTQYNNLIIETFNYPFLSFKDNKPAVVVTHGDELSLADRARVCSQLGELLGIPPAKQIFDIPGTSDHATEWAIIDMLHYSIEHADRNFPLKQNCIPEVQKFLLRFLSIDDWVLMLEVFIICLCMTVLFLRGVGKLIKW